MTKFKQIFYGTQKDIKSILSGRLVWVCLLSLSMCATMLYLSVHVKTVYIKDEGTTVLHYTLEDQPQSILNEKGISTLASDIVEFSGFNGTMGVINIDRAFSVGVEVDNRNYEIMTTEVSVSEFLDVNNISLGVNDIINLPTVFYLSENDEIIINRVEETTYSETEELSFETVYKDSPLLRVGSTRILEQGSVGEKKTVYADVLVDGKLSEREIVSETIVKKPVTKEVLRGANKAVSDLDFGIPLDANGVPVRYKQVLTNQIATGYSAGDTAYGASLMYLEDGYVAVRADEIPYGTKMYITSADNRFVYGFAIAADTGVGLMQNVIDVDLYYESNLESKLNGKKYVNIYILEDDQVTSGFEPSYRNRW